MHDTAEQRKKPTGAIFYQHDIYMPTSSILSAASRTPLAMFASVCQLLAKCMEEGSRSVRRGSEPVPLGLESLRDDDSEKSKNAREIHLSSWMNIL